MSARTPLRHRTRRALGVGSIALVVTLSLGLGACGSNDSKDADKGTTTTARGDAPGTTANGATTIADAPTDVPTLSGKEKEYADALISTYDAKNDAPFTKAHIDCLAKRWVPIIGVERFQAKGIEPADLAKTGSDMSDLKLDTPTATKMVDAMSRCNVDLKNLILAALTTTATAKQKACIDAAISTEDLKAFMVASFQGKSDTLGNGPFAAAEKCLMPAGTTSTTTP